MEEAPKLKEAEKHAREIVATTLPVRSPGREGVAVAMKQGS